MLAAWRTLLAPRSPAHPPQHTQDTIVSPPPHNTPHLSQVQQAVILLTITTLATVTSSTTAAATTAPATIAAATAAATSCRCLWDTAGAHISPLLLLLLCRRHHRLGAAGQALNVGLWGCAGAWLQNITAAAVKRRRPHTQLRLQRTPQLVRATAVCGQRSEGQAHCSSMGCSPWPQACVPARLLASMVCVSLRRLAAAAGPADSCRWLALTGVPSWSLAKSRTAVALAQITTAGRKEPL